MFKKSIKSGVMHIIKARIDAAQKQYDAKEKALSDEHKDTIAELEEGLEQKKIEAFDSAVKEFLGTVLN